MSAKFQPLMGKEHRVLIALQPGAFKGAIRVVEGDVPGLGAKWKHGYGRWVRDILVWTEAPFLLLRRIECRRRADWLPAWRTACLEKWR